VRQGAYPYRSARGTAAPPLTSLPTDVQVLEELHQIELRTLAVVPGVPGVASAAHALPFQRYDRVVDPADVIVSPTAMQDVEDMQATPSRVVWAFPAEYGSVVSSDHALPFHRSATPTPGVTLFEVLPTAVHAVTAVHEIALSTLLIPLGMATVFMVDHTEPFQLSASVRVPVGVIESPTAMHVFEVLHVTAFRAVPMAPAAFCAGDSSAHFEPFQRSTSAVPALTLLAELPTAVQALGDVHEIPLRVLLAAGITTGCTDQVVPFHFSTSGWVPVGLSAKPTAVHDVGDVQATELNDVPNVPFGWSAVCSKDQTAPFQPTASACPALTALGELPTATHVVGEEHEMPTSFPVTPAGRETD